MDKILIFGSGFLVRHIATVFLNKGYSVKIIYNKHKILDFGADIQTPLDTINVENLVIEFQPNYILFAVGDSYVPGNTVISEAIDRNLMFTLVLLEKLYISLKQMTALKKIIVIGSAAEYGNRKETAISETDALHPSTIYGLTKIFLYNTSMYYLEKGMPIIYTRQFNAIGPYQRDLFVLSSFCQQIAKIEKGLQEPELEVGDLSFKRDFIDARDAANAYYLLFTKGEIGKIYNVGSGKATSIQNLLDVLLTKTSYNKQKIKIKNYAKAHVSKNDFSSTLLSDNDQLKSIGYKSQYSIEDTITETLNYWRQYV